MLDPRELDRLRLSCILAVALCGWCGWAGCGAGNSKYLADHGGCPDLDTIARGSDAPISAREWAGPDVSTALDGVLDRSHVAAVVEAGTADLQRCYADALEVWPLAEGNVVLSFVVAADGSVARARIDRTELPPAIACCMREATRHWQFEPLDGANALLVTYPFQLVSDSMRAQSKCGNMGPTAITTYQRDRSYCNGWVEVGERQ